jgi:hypothetical protein
MAVVSNYAMEWTFSDTILVSSQVPHALFQFYSANAFTEHAVSRFTSASDHTIGFHSVLLAGTNPPADLTA